MSRGIAGTDAKLKCILRGRPDGFGLPGTNLAAPYFYVVHRAGQPEKLYLTKRTTFSLKLFAPQY